MLSGFWRNCDWSVSGGEDRIKWEFQEGGFRCRGTYPKDPSASSVILSGSRNWILKEFWSYVEWFLRNGVWRLLCTHELGGVHKNLCWNFIKNPLHDSVAPISNLSNTISWEPLNITPKFFQNLISWLWKYYWWSTGIFWICPSASKHSFLKFSLYSVLTTTDTSITIPSKQLNITQFGFQNQIPWHWKYQCWRN
jgi:hypothetical protein